MHNTFGRIAATCAALIALSLHGCGDNDNGGPPPTATATIRPSATQTAPLPSATQTAAPPTATQTSAPPSATRTSVPSATHTAVPPSATHTAVPPTATATRPPATATAPPATATFTNPPATSTSTPSSTPTATEAPTVTPTSAPVIFQAPELTEPAGPRDDGSGVLPSGRIARPIGRQATVNTMPLNLRVAPNGNIFVTNDGRGDDDFDRYLHVIEPQSLAVSKVSSTHFFGLAISPDGTRAYVSNSPNDKIDVFAVDGTTLTPISGASVSLPARTFPMGIDVSPDGKALYVTGAQSNTLWRIDLETGTPTQADKKIGDWPYSVVVSSDGKTAYVSSWGMNNGNPTSLVPIPLPPDDRNGKPAETRSSVAAVDISGATPSLISYTQIARSQPLDNHNVFGGSHPSAMALSPDGKLLYVTATNLDLLSVIDTATKKLVADVDLNTLSSGLQGLYPNALAVSADGRRVYVADAGINAVQLVQVDPDARTFTPAGFIPTGWYPTALGLSPDGNTLYVANAKGLGVGGNGGELIDISYDNLGATPYSIGRIIKGTVSAVDLASADFTGGAATVLANNGYVPHPAEGVDDSILPRDFGSGPSKVIKHVVYILKENRTYDQILGDLETANGDPRLTLFGENITPNQHALARQFAIGDNFFHDAEVSYPGHQWVTQGNNNDWVEKIWPVEYNDFLKTSFNVEAGQEGFCKGGYIFESYLRQGITLRSYGEPLAFNARFAAGPTGRGTNETLGLLLQAFGSIDKLASSIGDLLDGNIEKLRQEGVNVDILENQVWPHVKLDFPSSIQADRTDVERANLFKQELAQYEQTGTLPQFMFIWLPNDHTFGAAPNMPSVVSAIGDNDSGLGLVVDALSRSRFWNEMAVFVTEDDAQDGQDHVSAHRTLGYVISPYGKHGYVSHQHHSTMSMLKTMELLLGVQPMSQYDRYATDMRDYFTTTPDLTPYTALAMRVASERNPEPEAQPNALLREAGEVSAQLDFDTYDEAGPELSRVLWLVHIGEKQEQQRRVGMWAAAALPVLLMCAGMVLQRRRTALAVR